MTDKALIIETGEILDIISSYTTMQVSITIPGFDEEFTDYPEWMDTVKNTNVDISEMEFKTDEESRNDKYVLSNGTEYTGDELIVGTDEIRNWKLKKGLDI